MLVTKEGLGCVRGIGEFPDLEYPDLIINGAGYYQGFPFVAEECIIDISGTGRCKVSAENNPDLYIEGAGVDF